MIFNLNPFLNQKLESILPRKTFQIIYLSNILDWLNWHYPLTHKDNNKIFQQLNKVSRPSTTVIFEHLANREAASLNLLFDADNYKKKAYTIYRYHWEMYKFTLKDLI